MRKLFCYLLLAATIVSCQKKAIPEQADENLSAATLPVAGQSPHLSLNAGPGATDSITMDVPGDYVNAADDHLKNNTTGANFTADINGSGWLNGMPTTPVPIIKTSAARFPNTYALRYSLPARSSSVTYDQNDKDRLENVVMQGPIGNFLNTTHYSGFSIMIPSGKGNAPDWCVIHQMWQSAPESPPISLNLLPGYPARLALSCLWGKDKAHSHGGFQPRVDDGSGDTFIDLPRNKWIDFVIRWKLDTAATGFTGFCAVYRHDSDATGSTLIWNYDQQHLGYSNVDNSHGLHEKIGIYRKADYVNNLEIVYDQIRVGPTWASVQPWP